LGKPLDLIGKKKKNAKKGKEKWGKKPPTLKGETTQKEGIEPERWRKIEPSLREVDSAEKVHNVLVRG